MSNEKTHTSVIFRKFKGKDGGDIIALFPELNYANGCANLYKVVDYVHLGQHGESDPQHVINITVPAKPDEYADLKAELESIGYVLTVKKRLTYSKVFATKKD